MIKGSYQNFLGGPVVKNLPCNAGNMGSVSCRERTPHMSCQRKGLSVAFTDPTYFTVHTPQPESLCTTTKTPHTVTKTCCSQ